MGWTWRFLGPDGKPAPLDVGAERPDAGFPSQSDAESWIGEHWRELVEAGVDAVTLVQDGQKVYGPMGLNPPE